MFSTVDLFTHHTALLVVAIAPLAIVVVMLGAPALLRSGKPSRFSPRGDVRDRRRAARSCRSATGCASSAGRASAARPRSLQLSAWAVQWLSCYVLLVALGLDDQAGLGAAAAVLFAVNVTAVLPATPSNLGVFQAACVAVLTAYGVGAADALAYGIILQAVEIATAIVDGHAGARQGGPVVARGAPARDARLAGRARAPCSGFAAGDARARRR